MAYDDSPRDTAVYVLLAENFDRDATTQDNLDVLTTDQVWSLVRQVPRGKVVTYGKEAARGCASS